MQPDAGRKPDRLPRPATILLGLTAVLAFLLCFHNYGCSLLPDRVYAVPVQEIHPCPDVGPFAYCFAFADSRPDTAQNPWSRTRFTEDGKPHTRKQILLDEIRLVGGDRWAHAPGRIIFATVDNTDPRTNGRHYALLYPPLYSKAYGRGSLVVLLLLAGALGWLRRKPPVPSDDSPVPVAPSGRLHTGLALLVFCAGLYCNTGTLSPYGMTFRTHVDPATGNLYSVDHGEFRKTFAFLNGAPREQWEDCIILRRILFPALAWPFMRVLGFETGGLLMSALLAVGSFLFATEWMRHRIGPAGASCGMWILALYPGYAYWFAQPYAYACIAPGSMLLMIGLSELAERGQGRAGLLISLAIGMAYLAYDFAPFFLPATFLIFAFRRRWREACLHPFIQVLPLFLWLLVLRHVFDVPVANANTAAYGQLFGAYRQIESLTGWLSGLGQVFDVAGYVFLGANFLFLPALFIVVAAVNRSGTGTRLPMAGLAVLGSTLLLFLFINLAPTYHGSWPMSGSWIARLYQPVFPVMILAVARWWQQQRATGPVHRTLIALPLVATGVGNAMVTFGPILHNPGRVSETAFLQFYSHSPHGATLWYESNLQHHGAHPAGFTTPPDKASGQ